MVAAAACVITIGISQAPLCQHNIPITSSQAQSNNSTIGA